MPDSISSCAEPIVPAVSTTSLRHPTLDTTLPTLYSTPVQRPALTSTRRATLSVSTVRLGRCRAGERYASAALWRRPSTMFRSDQPNPSSRPLLTSAAIGYPSSAAAAKPASDTGWGDRAGATRSGPSRPRPAEATPARQWDRRSGRSHHHRGIAPVRRRSRQSGPRGRLCDGLRHLSATGLEQENFGASVLRQPRSHHAAGGARPDHDEVIAIHGEVFSDTRC